MNKKLISIFIFFLLAHGSFAQFSGNIEFVENKGQWDERVKYMGEVPAGAFYIRSNGFTVLQHNTSDLEKVNGLLHNHSVNGKMTNTKESFALRSHAFNVDFIGANKNLIIVPDKSLNSYNNYFIGNDPSKWASNCQIYQAVTVKDVYPGIDVRYYTNQGGMKYDIIARPGSDISKIALRYEGVDKLEVKNKELSIATSVGKMKESIPYSFLFDGKEKKEINCLYKLKDNIVRFDVKDHDPDVTLIIDPSLIFSSFSRSTVDNWGYTATYGPDGSMYGGGSVFGTGFPVTAGAFQQSYGGGFGSQAIDIGIIKLSANGVNRIYATYIGGSGNEQPHSLIVDAQGNLVVSGRSNSSNYPTTGPGNGQIGVGGGYDIIISKLNASGTALIGSKKIGGTNDDGVNISSSRTGINSLQQNYGDDGRSEVILDGAGNIYVASCTQSTDFPVLPNAGSVFQSSSGGKQDAVLLKFNSNVNSVLFSSYLGGSEDDAAYVLSLHPANGNIYVAGGTSSTNFPGNKVSTIGASNQGGIDGFVSIVSNNGSSLVKSTYLGTAGTDQVYGIQFDNKGFPYVMGQTTGSWPVINAAYSNAGAKQFIAKLETDLSAYIYSTVFGKSASTPSISPVAFLVDRCENVYVSGWGGSFNQLAFPSSGTLGLPITSDAFKTSTDGSDFYFFVLRKNATGQLFGSFFGQDGGAVDHVDGGTSRFDKNGIIYQAICANCRSFGDVAFPTTPLNVWGPGPVNPSPNCNLAMVKIAFNLAGVSTGVQSAINGVMRDTAGCVPLTVDFSDSVKNAVSYEWNFGDGSPTVATSNPNISHTYNVIGTYRVMLVGIDNNTCNVRDTSFLNIRVGDVQAMLAFNPIKLNPCDSFKYQFDNLSIAPAIRPFANNSFIWNFGDNTPRVISGTQSVLHSFASPGTYNVKLFLNDSSYCNSPDSVVVQLRIAAIVKAQFTTAPSGCVPYNAIFNNISLGGQSFLWNFGDGTTSTAISPTKTYNSTGTYIVTLVATDNATCNIIDSSKFSIRVNPNPIANFSFTPNPPVENTPHTFTNLSSADAVSFKWFFGDGDSLLTNSISPVIHQYNSTGTFDVCLIAINNFGCRSTICRQVSTIVVPALDVPNAFTPTSADVNSVILVRGFGIAKMKFIIWNRWGQKVFETGDWKRGWDGKLKGVLQPMDVYAYTLDVEFFDGTKSIKKGDITLIR